MPSWKGKKDPQNYHASDLRFLISQICIDEKVKELVGYYVGPENVDLFLKNCLAPEGDEQVEITESKLKKIIKEELSEALESTNVKSLPSTMARISSLLDPYLDAPVRHLGDGSEEYESEETTEEAIEALSSVIDLIQETFLNMMSGEPLK